MLEETDIPVALEPKRAGSGSVLGQQLAVPQVGPADMGSPEELALEMECAICFNPYNNAVRTPKLLPCQHTFCLECLARLRLKSRPPDSFLCPLCRHCTRLPAGGLPHLDTNLAILACLPEGRERAHSVHLKEQLWGRPKASRVAVTPQTPVSSISRSVETACPPWQEQPHREQRCCGSCWHKRLCLALLVMAAVVTITVLVSCVLLFAVSHSSRASHNLTTPSPPQGSSRAPQPQEEHGQHRVLEITV